MLARQCNLTMKSNHTNLHKKLRSSILSCFQAIVQPLHQELRQWMWAPCVIRETWKVCPTCPGARRVTPERCQKLRSVSRGRKWEISRGVSHLGCWGPPHSGAATGTHPLRVAQVRLCVDRASAHFQDPQGLEQAGMQPPLCILSCTYGASTALQQRGKYTRQKGKKKPKQISFQKLGRKCGM